MQEKSSKINRIYIKVKEIHFLQNFLEHFIFNKVFKCFLWVPKTLCVSMHMCKLLSSQNFSEA
jgi:hypothetical protein